MGIFYLEYYVFMKIGSTLIDVFHCRIGIYSWEGFAVHVSFLFYPRLSMHEEPLGKYDTPGKHYNSSLVSFGQ